MNDQTDVKAEAWDIQPQPESEEIEIQETASPEELRGDVGALMDSLLKIATIDPSRIGSDNPGNKHFGKKMIVAFERAKQTAVGAIREQNVREMVREERNHQHD